MNSDQQQVKLELKLDKIVDLMEMGVLCGADLHEIDPNAKQVIQQACLQSCARKVCNGCDISDDCGEEVSFIDSSNDKQANKKLSQSPQV